MAWYEYRLNRPSPVKKLDIEELLKKEIIYTDFGRW